MRNSDADPPVLEPTENKRNYILSILAALTGGKSRNYLKLWLFIDV